MNEHDELTNSEEDVPEIEAAELEEEEAIQSQDVSALDAEMAEAGESEEEPALDWGIEETTAEETLLAGLYAVEAGEESETDWEPAGPAAEEISEAGAETPEIEYVSPPDQGSGWLRLLFVGLLSAFVGALLALLFLWLLNGTLDFQTAAERAILTEVVRLDREIDALGSDLARLHTQVEALQGLAAQLDEARTDIQHLQGDLEGVQSQLEVAQAQLEFMGDELATTQTDLIMLRDDMDGMAENMLTLQVEMGALEDRLEALRAELRDVRQATQRFETFLTGLRRLLGQTLEPEAEATRAPSRPRSLTPPPNVTIIPLATPTPSP